MSYNTTGMVNDSSKSFMGTLAIWEAYFIIECVRCILFLVALSVSKKKIKKVLSWIHFVLTLNDGLGVVALIVLMVSRWSVPGRLCAGEYLEYKNSTYTNAKHIEILKNSTYVKEGYLIERGEYLLGLTVYVWIGLGIQFILGVVLSFLSCKKRLNNPKKHNSHHAVQNVSSTVVYG